MKNVKKVNFADGIGVIEVNASVFDVIANSDNIFGTSVTGICELTGKFTDCITVMPVSSNRNYIIDANLMAYIEYLLFEEMVA